MASYSFYRTMSDSAAIELHELCHEILVVLQTFPAELGAERIDAAFDILESTLVQASKSSIPKQLILDKLHGAGIVPDEVHKKVGSILLQALL